MRKINPADAEILKNKVFEELRKNVEEKIYKDWENTSQLKKLVLYSFLGSTKYLPAEFKNMLRRKFFSREQAIRHDFKNLKKTGVLRTKIRVNSKNLRSSGSYIENLDSGNDEIKVNNSCFYILSDLCVHDIQRPVDIIIPIGQHRENINKCLQSIKRFTKRESYRLLLCVLNGSDVSFLNVEPPDRIIFHDIKPFNFAAVNNIALKICSNDVVLLNDDTEVTEGWLEKLAESSRGWCLAGARTCFQCSGNPDHWGEGEETLTYYPLNMFCLYIPKRALEIVGTLDERYCYYGGEDVDYSIRALESGIPLIISSAYVEHYASKSFGDKKEKLMSFGFKQLKGWHDVNPPFSLLNKIPLISIIMPTYNRSGLLFESVLSLLKGEYYNIEIIIMDDGSTDETTAVVDQLMKMDNRIKYFKTSVNNGPDSLRMLGSKMANGAFIAFHDDDDVAHANRILDPLKFLISNPELDACYCDFNFIKDGIVSSKVYAKNFSRKHYMDEKITIGIGIMLIRKKTLEKCPLLPIYKHAIDFDWVFRMKRQGLKIEFCSANVLDYHTDSTIYKLSGGNDKSIAQHKEIRQREIFLDSLD